MANSDKNILITPNVSAATGVYPNIKFNGANNTPVTLSVLDDGTVSFSGTAGQLFSVSDGLSGTIFSVNDISGIPSIEVVDTGLIKLNQYGGSTVINGSAAIQNSSSINAKLSIYTGATTTTGLIIKGITGQTANVVEFWQSPSSVAFQIQQGTYPVYINNLSVGNNVYTNYQIVGGAISGGLGNVLHQFNSWNTSWAVMGVRGVASQTGNLQEWQNSAGTILAKVDSSGNITSGVINTTTVNASSQVVVTYEGRFGGAAANGVVTAGCWTTTIPQFVARGVSGQTANMQEWQDSAGTVLAKVDKDGLITSSTTGDSGWIQITSFTNSFTATNNVYYRKLNGVVWIRGSVMNGTANTTAFTLPSGYRPSVGWVIATQQYGTSNDTYVTIGADGTVAPNQTATWFNISFPVG